MLLRTLNAATVHELLSTTALDTPGRSRRFRSRDPGAGELCVEPITSGNTATFHIGAR